MTKPAKKSTASADESPLSRFTRTLRGLMAVPKEELDAKVAERQRRKSRRATAKG